MHLGGSSEQKELDFHPRSYFCPYYWTKRARQLTRASEEEGPKLRNLLNRRSRLLEKLEDERLCILDRADGSKDQYECVPASAEAWFRAGCVHGPSEQNIGRAPCTDEALDEDLESQMAALVFRGSHLCVSSDVPGTWPDPLPEAWPLIMSAQHVRLHPPRSTQVCAVWLALRSASMAAADQTELEVGELLRQNTAAIIGNSSPGAVEIFCVGACV